MVARTVTCDEMRALPHSGQRTAERSGSVGDHTHGNKKYESSVSVASGLFHTVTTSTPRAKRLARVYPHSSAVVGAAFRGAGELSPALQLSRQGAGDVGREDAEPTAMTSLTAHSDTRQSTLSQDTALAPPIWHHSASSHPSSSSDSEDDGSEAEVEYWSNGESELELSLTHTRVLQRASSAQSYEQQRQRLRSLSCASSDWSEGTATPATLCAAPRDSAQLGVQDDVLARVATLKALYDQGFISRAEYERRKSAIVDELTFFPLAGTELLPTRTSTAASAMETAAMQPNRMAIGRPAHGLPLIVPHGPNFCDVRPEVATKHVFDYATREWSSTHVRVALDETPFSKGSLRVVYHLLDVTATGSSGAHSAVTPRENQRRQRQHQYTHYAHEQPSSYVAKVAIDPDEDPQTYFRDTELQAHCAHYAQLYNSYKPPKRVEFIEAWVLELTERNGALCAVEPYIPGEYRKHNNNFGSVSDDERNTPQAFSHFTYEASNHELLAVDIQGVGDLYTDPQIHTLKGDDFGKGNLGVLGFHKFLSSHRCNSICRYLKLPAVNPKDRHTDSGTLPVQELMNRDRVRPTQFDSTHYYEHAPMLQKYITQCRALEHKTRTLSVSQQEQQDAIAVSSSRLLRFLGSLFCCNGS